MFTVIQRLKKFIMIDIKKVNRIVFFLLSGVFLSCSSGIPISTDSKYPIEVLYENEPLERPYSEIGMIEISNEDTLSSKQTQNKRMMYRGNDAKTKELLRARLVLKAQKIGADAIIHVKYQYYASVKSEGYIMSGLAVRYRGE